MYVDIKSWGSKYEAMEWKKFINFSILCFTACSMSLEDYSGLENQYSLANP